MNEKDLQTLREFVEDYEKLCDVFCVKPARRFVYLEVLALLEREAAKCAADLPS